MGKLYHVGIYCRLSVDDANNSAKAKNYIPADESVSIENQRELLSKFIMLNGWIETKTYIDDGYSGGNFQRPGFLEMLEDARNGVINLILVKDLSRLGRDFVEVGRYTDVIFPSLGVRFVSVLDCLDTEGDNTDMLHFRSLMNDYHLRDLSSKIKSVLLSKMKSGQFIGSYAPFGYRKSDEDKHKLSIDEPAAETVRKIFEMRRSGMSYGKITAALNQEQVPSPRFYCYRQMGKDTSGISPLWGYASVKMMLRNEAYIGTLVMNSSGTFSYKNKKRIEKPESEWIRIEGAHEPIISRDVWDAVQQINNSAKESVSQYSKPTEKLFTGKLFCADCGGRMNSVVGTKHYDTIRRYVAYYCGRNARAGFAVCSAHRISENILKKIVIAEIQRQAQAVSLDEAAVIAQIRRKHESNSEQRLSDTQQEIKMLRRRVRELEDMTAKLYEDKISGAITDSAFTVLTTKNEQERLTKAERLKALLSEEEQLRQDEANIQQWTASIRRYVNLQELDRETIDELIDHIEVGEIYRVEGKRQRDIKVYYRFVGTLD